MSPFGWLALCAALACAPLPSRAQLRLRTLGTRGRLGGGAGSRPAARHRSAWRRPALRARRLPVMAAAGCGALGYLAAGPALALAAAATAATITLVVSDALRSRARVARQGELAGCLDVLAAELDAGGRPADALAAAAESARHFGFALSAAAAAARAGADPADALAPVAGLSRLGHAWRVAAACGAPLSGVVSRVAGDALARGALQREVGAVLAGPRSSAALLAGLPALGLVLGAGMGAHPVAFLIHSPAGRWIGCAGVLLDVAGVLWTLRLTRRAQRA